MTTGWKPVGRTGWKPVLRETADYDGGVVPAETETVADGDVYFCLAGGVGYVVQIALVIRVLQIDGRVDDAIPDGKDGGGQLDGPGSSEEVAGHALGGTDEEAVVGVGPEGFFDSTGLADITHGGGGGVRIDVIHFLRIHPGMAQRHLHAAGDMGAFRVGCGQMIGIATDPVAGEFRIDTGSALFGVLQLLDDHDAGTFAHDKTIPAAVKGTGGAVGFVIPGGQGFHIAKAGVAHGKDGGFRAAAEEGIGIAELDYPPCFADVVIAGGTGGDDYHVRPMEAVLHADDATADVADHHRDRKRADPVRAFGEEVGVLLLVGGQPADATANHDPKTGRIYPRQVHPGVVEGHFSCRDAQSGITITAFPVLGHFEKRNVVEVLHLAADLAGIARGVELGDLPDPAGSSEKVFPEGFDIISYGGDDAHTSDDNAAIGHVEGS